uniref:Uncharacterized protein n=1 Tax=Romanomermis culicivorax TaxID=13658 RepID=A0A915IXW5_ROMCU
MYQKLCTSILDEVMCDQSFTARGLNQNPEEISHILTRTSPPTFIQFIPANLITLSCFFVCDFAAAAFHFAPNAGSQRIRFFLFIASTATTHTQRELSDVDFGESAAVAEILRDEKQEEIYS